MSSESEICACGLSDELHRDAKLVVEIYGDYVHANPVKYERDDTITIPSKVYYAEEKWEYDRIRLESLNGAGYRVIVVWETDDWAVKVQEIQDALVNTQVIEDSYCVSMLPALP